RGGIVEASATRSGRRSAPRSRSPGPQPAPGAPGDGLWDATAAPRNASDGWRTCRPGAGRPGRPWSRQRPRPGSWPARRSAAARSGSVRASERVRSGGEAAGTCLRYNVPGAEPVQPGGLVQIAEKRGDALSAADAHRHDAPLGLATLELVGQLDGQDGAGGAHRMAERDGAAVRVDLLRINF